jgi:60 kDa SS-A/Ro ribonucleoprotein
MTTNYARVTGTARSRAGNRTSTPPTQAIRGRESEMTRNAAGGVSFKMDDFGRLYRFLILGVEGNTYYTGQRELATQNVKCLDRCLKADGRRVVDMAIEASRGAFKQAAPIFVLASAASAKDEEVRQYALANLHRVCRTLSSLYTFANTVSDLRGWGRGLRRAFADWLNKTPVEKLAYQSWKYKNRDGWTAQDIMRKVHPVTSDKQRAEIFTYMAKPRKVEDWNPLLARSATEDMNTTYYKVGGGVRKAYPALAQIAAAEELLHMEGNSRATVQRAVNLIVDHRLTQEAVPSNLRKEAAVWEALTEDMPVTAAVRNLGAMTANGLLTPMSASQKKIVNLLSNHEAVERSGAHPMQFLIAARQYAMGKGFRGNLTWTPNQKVLDALDTAFYASFGNVPVTGGNVLVAVDVSGSMSMNMHSVMGIEGWNPIMAAGAMALVTMVVEPNSHLIGFDGKVHELHLSGKNRIDDLVQVLASIRGGATNTALPVHYARTKGMKVDAIVSYTDNETWAGHHWFGYGSNSGTGHVVEEVQKYNDKFGEFKFLNCAMVATGTSDVDTKDNNMFELVGMDANTPRIISEFMQGNL